MEFNLLVKDMLFFVSCKFEMAIIKIVQVVTEIIRFAFLYALSIQHNTFENKISIGQCAFFQATFL